MTPLSISITPPYKHHGPARPEFLAEQREHAWTLNLTKSKETSAAPESRSDAMIARGADPAKALGLEPDAPVGDGPGFNAAGPFALQDQIADSIAAEVAVTTALAQSKGDDASRDLQLVKAKQDAFAAHKEALAGYAEAAQTFQEMLAGRGRETELDQAL